MLVEFLQHPTLGDLTRMIANGDPVTFRSETKGEEIDNPRPVHGILVGMMPNGDRTKVHGSMRVFYTDYILFVREDDKRELTEVRLSIKELW